MSEHSLFRTHFLDRFFWACMFVWVPESQWPKTPVNFTYSVFVSQNVQFDLDMKKHSWVKKYRCFGGSKAALIGLDMRIAKYKPGCPGQHGCMVIPPVTYFCCLLGNIWRMNCMSSSLYSEAHLTVCCLVLPLFPLSCCSLKHSWQEGKQIGPRGWRVQLFLYNLTFVAALLKQDLRSTMVKYQEGCSWKKNTQKTNSAY